MEEGKRFFPLLKSLKTSERPLGQSVLILSPIVEGAYFRGANN